MTAPTTSAPTADQEPGRPGPKDTDDAFDHDRLPTPPGATALLLRSLLAPMKARVTVTTLLLLLQQAAVQAGPLLVAYAIDRAVPAFRDHDNGPLIAVGAGYLLCALASGGLQYAFILASARVNQDVLLDLRGRIFRHAQALSIDFHERYTSGRLISRSTTDVESLRELLSEGLQELVTVILSFLYISALLLWLDLGLGAVAVASFVPLYLLVRVYRQRAGRVYQKRSTAIAAVIVKFVETMNGIRPVRAFRREAANDADFAVLNKRHERVNGDALLEMARYVVGSRLVANAAVAGIVLWGAYRVAQDSLELGVLAAAVLYLRRLYDPIDRLGMFLNSYQSAAASWRRSRACSPRPRPCRSRRFRGSSRRSGPRTVLAVRSSSRVSRSATAPAARCSPFRPHPARGSDGRRGRLDRRREVDPGQAARPLLRPLRGRILLDGVDLRELAMPELRRGVVMVTQEAFLFSGTVAENIAIGRPDAGREEIERAAKAIGAHDFISALPDGYDTDVRKRGGRISAGQRQLVAFARALLADPAVLILDEATSSLDVPGERAVQRAMATVLRGRTAVVIAHRLSTVEIADRVLVMEHGRIVEDGTPAELVAGTGRFADLHRAWRDSLA